MHRELQETVGGIVDTAMGIKDKASVILYRAFRAVVRPFVGKGLGRFYPIGAIYRFLAGALIPEQQRLVLVNDYKMWVHTEKYKGIDGISQQLLFEGTYEKSTTDLFRQVVRPNMNVIDIGANIGYYTLLAAKLVGNKGRIFAFEPEPANYALLVKNIKINEFKNITALQKAVSNKTGKVKFFLDKAEPGAHSLYKVRESAAESIEVDCISLDDFFKDNEGSVDFIKIDVEGAEVTVLLGMTKLIERNKNLKILTEFWPPGLIGSGFSPREYWDKLVEAGFKFIYLVHEEKHGLGPAEFDSVMEFCKNTFFRHPTSVNLLCSRSPFKIGDSH